MIQVGAVLFLFFSDRSTKYIHSISNENKTFFVPSIHEHLYIQHKPNWFPLFATGAQCLLPPLHPPKKGNNWIKIQKSEGYFISSFLARAYA